MTGTIPSHATPTRRTALTLLGAGAALPFLPRAAAAAPLEALTLYGPPAGPSLVLASAVESGRFADIADSATFSAWRNPDELRAGLTSGQIGLSVVPVEAATRLYNRGFPIRLANVMTDGLLYIISSDPAISAMPDLAGRKVGVPFRGDTPEIIFNQLLAHHGLDKEGALEVVYSSSPVEAMQLLLAGRIDAALTTEPSVTAAILRGKQGGIEIRRSIDIQTAWGEMTGAAPVLPQAGLAITQAFIDANGDAVAPILAALADEVQAVLADPAAAAGRAAEALGLPAPVLAASIPHSYLVARPAAEARADIERMLTAMAGPDLEGIGGKLPDDGFYL